MSDAPGSQVEATVEEIERLARVGSWRWDIKRGTLWCSPGLLAILGLGAEEAEPRALLGCVEPEDQPALLAALRALEAGEAQRELRCRLRRPDGRESFARGWFEARRDEQGRLAQVVGVVQDVTSLEQTLRASDEQLSLARRLASLGRLAKDFAGDFDNQLAVIQGLSSVLEATLDGSTVAGEAARQLTRAGERARDLTQHLLALARAPQPLRRPDGSPGAEGELVLVVDDDPVVRRVAVRMLGGAGFRVVSASTGDEALALVNASDPPALLITDMKMPRMSGPDLARAMLARAPGLRVLFLSGDTRAQAVDPTLDRLGVFLEKPFTSATLLATVRGLLDRIDPQAALG